MSKINETLVMMAEQAEIFKIGDRNFQIIEVKEAEQQPDYSHLVGKWVKCIDTEHTDDFTLGKYYIVRSDLNKVDALVDNRGKYNGWCGENHLHFDLSNPSDTNPDEKKVWEKANEAMWEMDMIAIFETDYDCPKIKEHFEKEWKHIRAYLFLSKFADLCNEGRVVDWITGGTDKYLVNAYESSLNASNYAATVQHIAFLDSKARNYSLKVHEAIWKEYWGIEP